nr:hypothetical protein [bacterium]
MALKDGMVDGLLYKNGWRTVGPGGGGAQFYPGISHFNTDHMMVFCDMSASYMTLDGGKNWTDMSLKAKGSSVYFDPNDPDVVYVGSTGLYKSTDKGRHWAFILPAASDIVGETYSGDEASHLFLTKGEWPGGVIEGVAVNRKDSNQIAVALARARKSDAYGNTMFVYLTMDGGKTWRRTQDKIEGNRYRRLYFDPAAPADCPKLYAFSDKAIYSVCGCSMKVTPIALPEGASDVFSADAGMDKATGKAVLYFISVDPAPEKGRFHKHLWRSMDMGGSWQQLDYGYPSSAGGVPDGKQLACCESDASVIYLSVYRDRGFDPALQNYEGVKKSCDMGATWQWVLPIDNDFPANFEKSWMEIHYGYTWPEPPICMTVAPNNPDVLLYTTFGTSARTVDGGKNWQSTYSETLPDGSSIGRGLEVTTCYGVHFDPHNRDNMMISYTDIGLFRSENGGRSWIHSIQGIPKLWRNTCYWLTYDPEVPGRVWGAWGIPHDLPRYKLFRNNGFEANPQHRNGGIAKSDDGAAHWQVSNTGMDEHAVSTCILLDPTSPAGKRTLYATACGYGVYKSTDDGATWVTMNNGLGDNLYSWKIFRRESDGALILLNMRAEREGKLVEGEMYISFNGAESWQKIALPEGTNAPNDLAMDPRHPDRLYLACWPYDIDQRAQHGGVYRTDDLGKTWRRLPLPEGVEYTYGVTVDDQNPDTVFTVDFQQNCHRSDDGGNTWYRVAGYCFKWGHKAFVDPYNRDYIYITTFGSSVWYGPAKGNGLPYEDMLPMV